MKEWNRIESELIKIRKSFSRKENRKVSLKLVNILSNKTLYTRETKVNQYSTREM